MFEIRLESMGGLGANLAGKLLGEAVACHMGLNAQSFAEYGSEKRGSPVKAYVRFAPFQEPMRISSPVRNPDLLGIFSMGVAGKENVTSGIKRDTGVVVNTSISPESTREQLKLPPCTLYTIDATSAAMELKTRVNMIMLGALCAAKKEVDLSCVKAAVRDSLGKKYPEMLESNLRGIDYGYNNALKYTVPDDGKYPCLEYKEVRRAWGWDNAPLGGVNPLFGSTVTNRLDSSREGYIPIFNKDKCINCGLCDTACPDMVFQFAEGEYKGKTSPVNLGIDYYHCKGCLRCVEVCPTDALEQGKESDFNVKEHNMGCIHLLDKSFTFDNVGADGIVTGESTVRSEER